MRAAALFVSTWIVSLGCGGAPAESPDQVQARENARVEAAQKKAQERERAADEQRKREQDLAAQEIADVGREREQERKNRLEAQCASDRDSRRAHVQAAVDQAKNERARAAELTMYMQKNCTKTVIDDRHDEWACPNDAPPELRRGGAGIPSGIVQVQATPEEKKKNDRCGDVQDILKQASQ